MGVQLYFKRTPYPTKIVDIRARELIMENPIGLGQDLALRTIYWKVLLLECSLILIWKYGSHFSLILTFWN